MSVSRQISDEPAAAKSMREEELIARTVAGDTSAFDEIIIEYQDRIFNTLFRILGNRDDADEAAQETFLKAFRALPNFKGGSRFSTWLYRIALNAASDRIRKIRHIRDNEEFSLDSVSSGREDGAPTKVYTPSKEPPPDDVALARETGVEIQKAIDSLDEEFRSVIVLKDVEGMNYEEIARVLHVSLGTVKSRLFRARDKLRSQLKDLL